MFSYMKLPFVFFILLSVLSAPVHAVSLNVSTTGNGTVSGNGIECPSNCIAEYNTGTVITLTANPGSGSKFDIWSGAVSSTDNPISFTINGNMAINASFSEIPVTYIVTASSGTGGSISPTGNVIVTQGDSQSFAITPSTGYHVADVLVDGASVGAVLSYTFHNVRANHSISASFDVTINTFIITATAGSGGSISPSGNVSVNQGSSQTFTITPATGYHVTNVLVDGASVGAVSSYTFTSVTTNHSISASFAVNITTFTITATAGSGGSISPSGNVSVNQGSSQTFTITPATGHHVADVLVDGASVGAVSSYTFPSVAANHSISASFAVNVTNIYTITASAGSGGSISPSGNVSVTQASSQTFTISPTTGYQVADVLVDGVSVGAVLGYTFSNVTANHTISVSFVSITGNFNLNITLSGQGSVATNPQGGKFAAGTQVTLLATASTGWAFYGWSGDITGLENPVTITMDADKTINAVFEEDQDIDGESNSEEMGPDGTDESYDGNKDGIPDWQQVNVVSRHTYDGKNYVTLAAPEGTTISDVTINELPKGSPGGYSFPYGLISFRVTGITPGSSTNVEVFLPQGQTGTTYYKYDATSGSWTDFFFNHENQTGAEINGNVITLHFIDGLRGDQDGTANGIIIDPGTLALKHQNESWYQKCFISAADTPEGPDARSWLVIIFFIVSIVWASLVIQNSRARRHKKRTSCEY